MFEISSELSSKITRAGMIAFKIVVWTLAVLNVVVIVPGAAFSIALGEYTPTVVLPGQRGSEATRADEEEYVEGLIDLDEFGRRVRARYGVE